LNPSRLGTRFQFQFYTEQGTPYRVSRTSSLETGPWEPVLTIEGTGAVVTLTDPAATSLNAYYRVEY
jgi:hypothetical protein